MSRRVRVRVPATTANVGPAFDCMGIALQHYNTVWAELVESGVDFEIAGEGSGKIHTNEKNIIYAAFSETAAWLGKTFRGVKFGCENKIPLNHGLGSSSAAIVSGIMCANLLLDGGLSKPDMVRIATKIEGHPDNVAPAIYGGVTVSTLAGDRVDTIRFIPACELDYIVSIPDYEVSTLLARAALPKYIPFADAVYNVSRAALLTAALVTGDVAALKTALDDRLHQPHRAYLMPGMKAVFAAAKEHGAIGAVISGAGPTMLALAERNADNQVIADAMSEGFRSAGKKACSLILALDTDGAREI